jgi:hypothetical protein
MTGMRIAVAPRVVSVRQALATRKQAEVAISTGWATTVALTFAALIALAAFVWFNIAVWQSGLRSAALNETVQRNTNDRRQIEQQLAGRPQSPLARRDGSRDYSVAWALHQLSTSSPGLDKAAKDQPAVMQNLQRAIERNPANVWYWLTMARLADAKNLDESRRAELWKRVEALPTAEPAYWNEVGVHRLTMHDTPGALAAFTALLRLRPEQTSDVFRRLRAAKVTNDELLAVAPRSAVGGLAAAQFFRQIGDAQWRACAEALLESGKQPAIQSSADELHARSALLQMLGNDADAIVELEAALLQQPNRLDWRIELAQARYQRQEYAESARHADFVLRRDPTTELADQARLLRDKIEIAEGKSR